MYLPALRRSLLWALLLLPFLTARGQIVYPIAIPYDVPPLSRGALDFGDLDGDGDLDLAVTGQGEADPFIGVYRLADILHFAGETALVPAKRFQMTAFSGRPSVDGDIRWGDYDGDGDHDLVVTGLSGRSQPGSGQAEPIVDVYENIGVHGQDAWFADRMALPGLHRSSADWGDVDGDGDLDIVASGLPAVDATQPVTRIYRNNGGQFEAAETGLPGTVSGDVALGDYDGDGLDDVAIMGDTGRGDFVASVFRNTGGGFVDSGTAIPGIAYGSLDWGDLEGDGDLDLLVTGGRLDARFLRGVTQIYRNDGDRLVQLAVDLPGWTLGQVRWGDADLDGDLDLFALGASAPLERATFSVYTFENGAFSMIWELTGARFATLAVDDYNADGDADATFIGETSDAATFRFLSNRSYPECLLAEWVPRGASQGDCIPD